MISLRQRLSRGLMSVLCVIFVLHWLAADWVIRSTAEKQMANRLQDDAFSLAESLTVDDNDAIGFSGAHISTIYDQPQSGHYYQIAIDGHARLSPSLAGQTLALPPLGPDQFLLDHATGPNDSHLLVLGLGLVKFGHRINIYTAEDLTAVDHDITAIRVAYFGLTLLILFCAISLQRWDVGRALSPLDQVGRELEQVAGGKRQCIDSDVPIEIKPLVDEINRLLDLVVRRLQQSRSAIGNLAHALKPPMAMLFKATEHPAFDAHPELQGHLKNQTDAIHRHIERELNRARIAGDSQTATTIDLADELAGLTRVLQTIHADKALHIDRNVPDVLLHFDREDLLAVLGNLLDNACKWARRTVRIDIAVEDRLDILIEDDGPGCNDEALSQLTQRGLRLDESVQGHGLGLGIVADVVQQYHGDLTFRRGERLGGLLVAVRLPVAHLYVGRG